jgi:hypothetical protein
MIIHLEIFEKLGGYMSRIKFCVLVIFTFAILSVLNGNTPPSVTNVSASQRTDGSKIVDIWYSVNDADNDTLTVSLAVSNDNGATFGITPSPANLSGAVGENILSGSNKHIVWNAGSEGIAFNGSQFKVKVTATEKINLSNGLVAYYPFNGNANDESGNGHDATTIGASFTQDRFGQLNHAASHSYDSRMFTNISINAAKSLVFWLKTDAQPTTGDGFGIGFLAPYPTSWAPNGSNFGFTYGLGSNNDFAFSGWWYDYSIQNQSYMWSNDNVWHMVAVTMDENYSCKIYIDGIRQMQLHENLTGNIVSEFTLTPSLFQFLIQWSASEGIPGYTVNVDDIRIYNRPITADEVAAIFHEGGWPNLNAGMVAYYPFNGNANDESGNNRNGVLVSSPGFSADRFGVSGKAVRFHTNTDEHVSIPYYYYGLNPISISVWFKSMEIPDYPFIALISLFDATTGVDYRIFQTDSSIGVAQHNPGVTWNSTSLFPISLNSWYHIVATYSDHYLSLYINGEFYNSVHCSNPSIPSGLSTEYNIGTMFGVHDPEIYSIGGDVDDVRFYNRVLTNSDIQALYHEGGWNGN